MARKKENKKQDLDFEIAFYEDLLNKLPDFVPALTALGDAYTKKGDYQKGLEIDLRLSGICPDEPLVFYNLACSYSLLRLIDEALASLKKAVSLGYEDFEYLLRDADLKNLREDSRFNTLFKELKKA